MLPTPHILFFAGSTRRESLHKKLARSAAHIAQQQGAVTRWIDLADYPLPLYDGDLEAEQGQPGAALALRALVQGHDALVIASPEYNGFFSPVLKNTLDWLSRPLPGEERHASFKEKPVLLLSTARGESGGARGLQPLRQLLTNLKAVPHAQAFNLPNGPTAFDAEDGLNAVHHLQLTELVSGFVDTLAVTEAAHAVA